MDMQQIMQQAQEMQQKMQSLQDQLAEVEVHGQAGGGMVKVTMTCKGSLENIDIDPSVIDPDDKEMLEDLVKAAINDAKGKIDQTIADETQKMMQGMGMPAGMELPGS